MKAAKSEQLADLREVVVLLSRIGARIQAKAEASARRPPDLTAKVKDQAAEIRQLRAEVSDLRREADSLRRRLDLAAGRDPLRRCRPVPAPELVEHLDVGKIPRMALLSAGIERVADLCRLTHREVLKIPYVGRSGRQALVLALQRCGLAFAPHKNRRAP